MARLLYTLAWFTALPLVAGYLLWRSLRQPEYRQHWGERFLGRGASVGSGPVLWVHAVSVGETRAAEPLIEQLAAARPDLQFVLTHMTPTGRAVGAGLVQRLQGRLVQRYLPYELPFALARFLQEVAPAAGVVLETEIWPNLLAATRARGVPMLLVNARLSERSLARGRRYGALMREAARGFTAVLAQSDADRARLAQLYDGPIEVAGNLKFDLAPPADLIARGRALRAGFGARPVWLLASSREGEEAMLLDALAAQPAGASVHDVLLIVVPRHPQRFDEVARLIEARGRACLRRSCGEWPASPAANAVLLGDTMGELALYYGAADLTIMGGSFGPYGSQNLIESCAAGTPVVLGPSRFNFAQAAADAVAAGAALPVTDMGAALRALQALAGEPARLEAMRAAAAAFAQSNRGATGRTVARVLALLPAAAR